MSAEAGSRILARAEELADTSELADEIIEITSRARAAGIDQGALGGLVRAVRALDGDPAALFRAVRSRGRADRFAADHEMLDAVSDVEDEIAQRARAVRDLRHQGTQARRQAQQDRTAAENQLARARAMHVTDLCTGCHQARAHAIESAQRQLAGAQEREDLASGALEVLAPLAYPAALQAVRRVPEDLEAIYEAVYDLVHRDPHAMPKNGTFITGEGAGQPADPEPAEPLPCAKLAQGLPHPAHQMPDRHHSRTCPGIAPLKAGARVEYGTFGPGGGDRLGEIQRAQRQHGQDGYLVIPLSLTQGDGFLPMWYPASRVKPWQRARWSYDAVRNAWSRVMAAADPTVPGSEVADAAGDSSSYDEEKKRIMLALAGEPERHRRAAPVTICHASRHPSARKELPDLVPGDLIERGTGMTFYGGGLGIGRVSQVARSGREILPGRHEDEIAPRWQARDARGEVIASGTHDWSTAAIAEGCERPGPAGPSYEPAEGDRVRARRYLQPHLRAGDGANRELRHEWTGTATGPRGMLADNGQYVDFRYMFLGGSPKDGTCAYLVTDVEPLRDPAGQRSTWAQAATTARLASFNAQLAEGWKRRAEQTGYLRAAYGIDPAKVSYLALAGRPGEVAVQLSQAQDHLLNRRFAAMDRELGAAIEHLQNAPGTRGARARRSVEELRQWLQGCLGKPKAITLIDGESRPVTRRPDGSWTCPWCESPAGMPGQGPRADFDRGCPNPGCLASMPADRLTAWKEQQAADERERHRRAAIADFTARQAEERRHAQEQLWADLEAQASEKGACLRCLRESDWRGGRAKLVRHRTKNYHDDG
jgi:hypothetical protein